MIMNDMQETNATTVIENAGKWNGLTLDELRYRRGIELVRREMGREAIAMQYKLVNSQVSQTGVRGLFLNKHTLSGLKFADYVFIGYKLVKLVLKLRGKRKKH